MGQSSAVLQRFAKKLRNERQRRGFSQKSLASKTGLSRNYIGMMERAEANVTIETLERVAKVLAIESYELLRF